LASETDFEVVGTAANATAGLSVLEKLMPDVVTLDVEMPGMNGLELLDEIRKRWPKLPVIMFSSLTRRAAETTLEALARGATDYVTKPTGVASREEAVAQVRSQLAPKIRVVTGRAGSLRWSAPAPMPVPVTPSRVVARPTRVGPRPSVLAVGTSTGGPNALAALFADFPADFSVPILIVQHMPPLFTKFLADRLSARGTIRFQEAEHGAIARPGHAYIAPGDFHLQATRVGTDVVLQLTQAPPESSCRPAVDVLFRSLAASVGANTLAVVLTGMGQDGLKGCRQLREAGASILAQDEASSVVWGMPGFVVREGLADATLPLNLLAAEIFSRTGHAQKAASARPGALAHG
jgi:two-component system chemotaxis response regulator CheB